MRPPHELPRLRRLVIGRLVDSIESKGKQALVDMVTETAFLDEDVVLQFEAVMF